MNTINNFKLVSKHKLVKDIVSTLMKENLDYNGAPLLFF